MHKLSIETKRIPLPGLFEKASHVDRSPDRWLGVQLCSYPTSNHLRITKVNLEKNCSLIFKNIST